MIVRILGAGQFDVPDRELAALNALDTEVESAVDAHDDRRFHDALSALLAQVRAVADAVPDDTLLPSDLVLPSPDASLEEVRAMLGDEGLVPG